MAAKDMIRAAKIVLSTVLICALVAGVVLWKAMRYPDAAAGGPKREAKIVVEKGTTLGEIARRLHDKGVIDHPSWFRFYANEQGLSQKIRAGKYTFSNEMSPRQVLDKLVEGVPVEEVSVTIPEGKN